MSIRAAEKIHLDEAAFQEKQAPPSELQEEEQKEPETGLALHQVFNQDILDKLAKEFVSQDIALDAVTPSLWRKILSWWNEPEKTVVPSPTIEKLTETQLEPINSVPVLEAPDYIPADLQTAKFPSPPTRKVDSQNKLTPSEIAEGLALMSEKSIESIMFIIFKAQIELEKENANIAEGTFSKYLDFQKLQQKVLQEIKDVLVKDENVAKHLKGWQNVTLAAAMITGIAAVAVSYGLVAPAAGLITTAFNPQVAAGFSFFAMSLGTVGPAVTAGLTGLTTGIKAYFQRRMDEHKANHEEYVHRDRYYNDRTDDARQRLMATAEADSAFKEQWIRLLKRSDRMRNIVLKK